MPSLEVLILAGNGLEDTFPLFAYILFGKAVDISDAQNKFIIGAPKNHSFYFGNSGVVYIFDASDGTELKQYYGSYFHHH